MIKRFFSPTVAGFYRGAAVTGLAVLAGVSCRGEAGSGSDRAADSAALATQSGPAVAGRYSVQDFGRLRWLEGSWRGQLPDGGHFYERYRLLDDSTIAMGGFPDSLFVRATDSARLAIRAGTVVQEGGARSVATRLDSSGVDFALESDASNNFTWTRDSPDRWTATLRSIDRDGHPRTTVYPMERIRRQATR